MRCGEGICADFVCDFLTVSVLGFMGTIMTHGGNHSLLWAGHGHEIAIHFRPVTLIER